MSRALLDLAMVPAPDAVAVLDHAAKVAAMKAELVAARPELAPVLALESEPLVKLIKVWAYEAILKASEINQGVRAVLLPLASGADLDNLAANLTVQRLAGEGDAALRQRAALGPEGWASAGPANAYRFHALSASPLVADVAVSSPTPGVVRVVILSTAPDGVADVALLATVAAALNAEDVRPFTDQVEVVSAGVVPHDVVGTLKLRAGPDAGPVSDVAVAEVRAYAARRRRLGLGVARTGYIAALMRPGVEDVVLQEPLADIPGAPELVPVLGAVQLTIEVVG